MWRHKLDLNGLGLGSILHFRDHGTEPPEFIDHVSKYQFVKANSVVLFTVISITFPCWEENKWRLQDESKT